VGRSAEHYFGEVGAIAEGICSDGMNFIVVELGAYDLSIAFKGTDIDNLN